MSLSTPVAFLIFNRPDTTARVFEKIRRARPPKLLVVADGPRVNHQGEPERCSVARAIVEKVDWPCQVLKNYSDVNLGCKKRVSSGLDWVFDTVEEAIILEDDCLPHPSFFKFCEELLNRYREDKRIAQICGANYQFGRRRTSYSYYFSRLNHIWGWASWRRAWKQYDVTMKSWPEVRNGNWLVDLFGNRRIAQKWASILEKVYRGDIDTWDYQWTYACWSQHALAILPNVNLISNIGFAAGGTHTLDVESEIANLPLEEMHFPLIHPPVMFGDAAADQFTMSLVFHRSPLQFIVDTVKKRILG